MYLLNNYGSKMENNSDPEIIYYINVSNSQTETMLLLKYFLYFYRFTMFTGIIKLALIIHYHFMNN